LLEVRGGKVVYVLVENALGNHVNGGKTKEKGFDGQSPEGK